MPCTTWLGKEWKWHGMEMFDNDVEMSMAWHGKGMASTGLWDWVWEGPLYPCVLSPKNWVGMCNKLLYMVKGKK
jgi:hypothetical protein